MGPGGSHGLQIRCIPLEPGWEGSTPLHSRQNIIPRYLMGDYMTFVIRYYGTDNIKQTFVVGAQGLKCLHVINLGDS